MICRIPMQFDSCISATDLAAIQLIDLCNNKSGKIRRYSTVCLDQLSEEPCCLFVARATARGVSKVETFAATFIYAAETTDLTRDTVRAIDMIYFNLIEVSYPSQWLGPRTKYPQRSFSRLPKPSNKKQLLWQI